MMTCQMPHVASVDHIDRIIPVSIEGPEHCGPEP